MDSADNGAKQTQESHKLDPISTFNKILLHRAHKDEASELKSKTINKVKFVMCEMLKVKNLNCETELTKHYQLQRQTRNKMNESQSIIYQMIHTSLTLLTP